jgi:hypothetical protein
VLRFCEPGRHYVDAREAQLLRVVVDGPDAGRRVYGCAADIPPENVVPAVVAATGPREDA